MSVGYHSACLYDVTADEYSCCRHSLRTIIALLIHAHSLYAIFVSLVISFFEFGYALIILRNCIIIGQSNFKRYVFFAVDNCWKVYVCKYHSCWYNITSHKRVPPNLHSCSNFKKMALMPVLSQCSLQSHL